MAKAGFPNKHKALKLEEVKPGVNYAFTINPIDKLQMFKSFTRISDINKESHKYLAMLKHYVLYPELSPKGRFHYHGWIWFDNDLEINEFYLSYLPSVQSMASYEMDTIEDLKVWTDYCTKQHVFHKYYTMVSYYHVPLKHDFKME